MVSQMVLLALTQAHLPKGAAQRQVLEAKYLKLNQATKRLDYKSASQWIAANTASGFHMAGKDGSFLTADQTSQMLRNEFLILKSVKSSTVKLSNFSYHPDHISCTVRTHLDALTKDKKRLLSDSITVNTWKPFHGAWKLAQMVVTRQSTSVNGRPLPGG